MALFFRWGKARTFSRCPYVSNEGGAKFREGDDFVGGPEKQGRRVVVSPFHDRRPGRFPK